MAASTAWRSRAPSTRRSIPDKLFMRISGVSKKADGYVDQLDFTCMMNQLGTPQLAGTFPTSDTSAEQRGCKIGTFGGTQLNAARAMLRYVASDRPGVQLHRRVQRPERRSDAGGAAGCASLHHGQLRVRVQQPCCLRATACATTTASCRRRVTSTRATPPFSRRSAAAT